MDDDDHRESDNFDTQMLYLKVNLRFVSAVFRRDMTLTRLLFNKPNTDELMANLAPAEMDLIHLSSLILQKLCYTLLTKRKDVIWCFFETMSYITRLTIERALDTLAQLDDLPRRSTARSARRRHLRYDPDEGRKGHVLLCILPGRL